MYNMTFRCRRCYDEGPIYSKMYKTDFTADELRIVTLSKNYQCSECGGMLFEILRGE